jgi:tRNA G18 (ribose-2'-O)-methylase SpoU
MKNKPIVLLENIRSLFNVGSIFRTAEFFGFEKVILTGFTPYPPNEKISKTAIGAEKHLNWQYYQDTKTAIEKQKKAGYKIYSIELNKKAVNINTKLFNKDDKICVVLGNEINGVTNETLKKSDKIIQIPKLGKIKESLNVEVCFGIVSAFIQN